MRCRTNKSDGITKKDEIISHLNVREYLNIPSIINCKQKQDCSNHRNITKKGTDFLISKYLNSANL